MVTFRYAEKGEPMIGISKDYNCFFCENHKEPSYKEVEDLKKFLRPDGLIQARSKTGCCPTHQQHLTKQIKRAKEIALM